MDKKRIVLPVSFLHKLGIKPNHLTVAGLILAITALFLPLIPALILFTASFILDVFDGNLARRFKLITKFGGILDSVCDKIVEVLFIYYMASSFNIGNLAILSAGLSILISYVKHRSGLKINSFFDRAQRLIFLLLTPLSPVLIFYLFNILCVFALIQLISKIYKLIN